MRFRSKLSLGICCPIVLVGVFFARYFPAKQERDALANLRHSTESIAGAAAPLLATMVDLVDLQKAALDEQTAMLAERVGYVAVTDIHGKLVAEAKRTQHALAVTTKQALVIQAEGQPHFIGTLTLGADAEKIRLAKREALGMVLLIVLLLAGGSAVVAWLIAWRLAAPVALTSHQLSTLANHLLASARQQEAAAGQSSAAVEETQRSMLELEQSAETITHASMRVVGASEEALRGNQIIEDKVIANQTSFQAVAELSQTIAQIAARTDILALNAGLEGTRAGEAGKGFALVAEELRRLAERVLGAAEGIKRVTESMAGNATDAVNASRSGLELANEATDSAREIVTVTQRQRTATSQVSLSMEEMTHLLRHNLGSIRETSQAAEQIHEAAGRLLAFLGEASANAPARETQASPDRG